MNRYGQKIAAVILSLAMSFLTMGEGSVYAADPVNNAAQIKMAMLYNVLKFVTWESTVSTDNAGEIVIGAVGSGEFNDQLSILDGKTLGNKRIKVIALARGKAWPENLNVLSVGLVEKDGDDQLMKWEKRQGVLTVSDLEDFAISGGIIGFVLDEGRVKFDINLDAAKANKIIISSKLAALAKVVLQDGKARNFR